MAWSDAARRAATEARKRSRTHQSLVRHSMFSKSDYKYLRKKGNTKKDVLKLWNRDAIAGKGPVRHQRVFDIVGYLNRK